MKMNFWDKESMYVFLEEEKTNNPSFVFESVSLSDFVNMYCDMDKSRLDTNFVCIDVANGNMKKLHDAIMEAKHYNRDSGLVVMAGNVGSPDAFYELAKAGADLIRVGIGNGGGCFVKGTKILTKDGEKNIEDVNTDDFVLTHRGNYKPVILTHVLNSGDELVSINGTISTKDHEYFVIKKSDKDIVNENNYLDFGFWIEANDIDENLHLIIEVE
jgi:hypothetical protein